MSDYLSFSLEKTGFVLRNALRRSIRLLLLVLLAFGIFACVRETRAVSKLPATCGARADCGETERDAQSPATPEKLSLDWRDGPDELTDLSLSLDERVLCRAPMDVAVQPGIATGIEDGSGTSLAGFYDALQRTQQGQGQARIVFYGASHVASDYYTGYIRQNLQNRYGGAGAGFVLPAKPWPWYRNAAIEFQASRGWKVIQVKARDIRADRYGLAGVALEARANRPALAAFRTRTNSHSATWASRFELFFLRQPHGGKMRVSIDGKTPRVVSTASASVETGYELFEVPDGPHRFELQTLGDGTVRIFGVAVERDAPGVILDTLGVPGSRAAYHLAWDDAIYREHLARRRPDLVVLAYGTNEAGDKDKDVSIEQYQSELRKVVARVRDVVPTASCLLVGPSDRPEQLPSGIYAPRARAVQIVEIQKKVAAHFQCGFFDMVACTGGPLSMIAWASATPPYGAPDLVHFTRIGYERIGDLLLHGLLSKFPERTLP